MDTLKKMHTISIIWGMIIVTLFAICGIFSYDFIKNEKYYVDLENEFSSQVKDYVDKNSLYPEDKSVIKFFFDDIKNDLELNELKVKKDKCDGFVVAYVKDGQHRFDPYIKCHKYVTKNYNKKRK